MSFNKLLCLFNFIALYPVSDSDTCGLTIVGLLGGSGTIKEAYASSGLVEPTGTIYTIFPI